MSNKILLVDDAMDDLALVKAMLDANGFNVLTASHGREGLEKARKHEPNLIISDVLMPEMDGFALFKELKKDARTAKIPIMILTVRGRMRDTFEAFGVEHFLPKPFNTETLFSLINKFVTPESKSATPVTPAPAAAPVTPQPEVKSPEKITLATAKKRALIFGSDDHVMENMARLLENEKCHAVITKDETQLPVQVDSLEPDLIVLQLNTHTATPIHKIIFSLNSLVHKKVKGAGANVQAARRGDIVLYKVEEEMSGLDSMGASLADTESVVDRCLEEGCKKYIGSFSSALFISKIREFIV